MKLSFVLGRISVVCALASANAAVAAPQTYTYAVSHSRYGAIGTYVRTIEDVGGVTRAQSQLRIAVKVMGLVVHRENASQVEIWRGPKLMSFQSTTTTNGQSLKVHGEARDNSFMVTSPAGTTSAPADVAPSDPWAFSHMGPGVIVSIKSGKVETVKVTGGEPDRVLLHGVWTPARHFHVSTDLQPNKWEVWLDSHRIPIKFRSLERSGAVDFTLVSPLATNSSDPVALGPAPVGAGSL
jgi:hypothetical protein